MIRAETDSNKQLRSLVERIEKLFEEIDAIKGDVKDVYAEAKFHNFDKTALGQVISIRRRQKKDPAKFEERDALVQSYLDRLEQVDEPSSRAHPHVHAPARAREEAKPAPAPLRIVEPVTTPAPASKPFDIGEIPAAFDRRGSAA